MNTPLEDMRINADAHEMETDLKAHPEDFSEAIDLAIGNREGYNSSATATFETPDLDSYRPPPSQP